MDKDVVNNDLSSTSHSAYDTTTVVKFVPCSYFNQIHGAEILLKLDQEDAYDASLVEECILLSSSHTILMYTQLYLGADLAPGTLALDNTVGSNHCMIA